MKSYQLGVLHGDGIGPEIAAATVAVLDAAAQLSNSICFEWVKLPMGWEAIDTQGDPLPPETAERLTMCHGWIMGPHDSASYPPNMQQVLNPSGKLRKHFNLYANIRPARTYPAVPSLGADMNLVVVRENTEGFYADRNMYQGVGEFMPTPDVALAMGLFSRGAAERIAHVACRLAQSRWGHMTIVHKANVLRLITGLFLDTCRAVAEEYPSVHVDDYHIDAMAAHLLRRASDFDVIVTTNMFGDILSDLTAELAGSLGTGGALNAGENYAMAQAVHGAAPDIAGQGIANPTGLFCSAVMLLEWMCNKYGDAELQTVARRIDDSLFALLSSGPLTQDMGGSATTAEFTQALIARIQQDTSN